MPRPKRVRKPNLTYHIYSRCIEWRNMMKEDRFKDIMISILQKTQERYRFELIFYEIMDDHFHLIIKTLKKGPSISRIMQYIKARFAERYNREVGRIGPFWNERFKDIIIDFLENPVNFLLWLLWHLAINPVRNKRINDPRDYKYGSIKCYLDEDYNSPVKITLHDFFNNLANSFKERVSKFQFFEDAYRRRLAVIW
jgi:putative transposase